MSYTLLEAETSYSMPRGGQERSAELRHEIDVLRTVGRLKVARDYAAVGIASSGKGTVSRGERFAVDAKATSIFKFCRFELAGAINRLRSIAFRQAR
mgnify:CR=1 FL=1